MSDLITSPEGNISFAALATKVGRTEEDTKKYKALTGSLGRSPTAEELEDGGIRMVHTLRLEFDGDSGAAFKKAIQGVNPRLIGNKHASKPGNFTVQASSKFPVTVINKNGDEFAEGVPAIVGGKGRAKMVVKPYTGNAKGNGLNLVAVSLLEFEEYSTEEATEKRAAAKQHIRDLLKS